MDTRMLDVAIGLVLVIALLSLVATAAQEALAAMRNSRGRNLARLICSLVGDNKVLSQAILDHPFIQSMAMELPDHNTQRTPSYLSSDVFVTGLLGFLTKYTGDSRPATPAALVDALRFNLKQDSDQKFSTSLAALLPGVENDWPAFEKRLQAWFDAVGERSSGWYKRKNQLSLFVIGSVLAAAINVNPFVISKALWNDAALRKSAVEQAGLALQAYQAQSNTSPGAYGTADAVRRASAPNATNVPNAPNAETRATDKALNTINVVLELALKNLKDAELSKASDTVMEPMKAASEMRRALARERFPAANDPKLLAQRDEAAAQFDFFFGMLRQMVPTDPKPTGCVAAYHLSCPVLVQLDQALKQLEKAIQKERAGVSGVLGRVGALGANDPATAILTSKCEAIDDKEPALAALCEQLRQLGVFMPAGMPLGWSEATWPRVFGKCAQVPHAAANPCPGWTLADWTDVGNWSLALVGWLFAGLGVTLGAPFWFDLLGKLMKVRSSGVKPVEGDAAVTAGTGIAVAPSTLTPAEPGAGEAAGPASNDAFNDVERQLSEDEITRIQRSLGMPATAQTGRLDLATRTAIGRWQTQFGAAATGQLTQVQIQQLLDDPTTLEDDGYVG